MNNIWSQYWYNRARLPLRYRPTDQPCEWMSPRVLLDTVGGSRHQRAAPQQQHDNRVPNHVLTIPNGLAIVSIASHGHHVRPLDRTGNKNLSIPSETSWGALRDPTSESSTSLPAPPTSCSPQTSCSPPIGGCLKGPNQVA